MLPERTTTIGEGESVTTESPFQSIKAVDRTRPKFRSWERWCRTVLALRFSGRSVDNIMFGVVCWFDEDRCLLISRSEEECGGGWICGLVSLGSILQCVAESRLHLNASLM